VRSWVAAATAEVGAVAAGWRAWLAHEKRQAPASVKAYQSDLVGFLGFCAEHRGGPPTLDELTGLSAADFRAWLAARHRQGLARTSTARALAALRSFYRYLDRQHGRHNPALKALRTPRLPKRLPRPLSSGQAQELIDHVPAGASPDWLGARDLALLLLLYGAGLRIGEALALDRSALGRAPAALQSLTITGKGGRQRLVPVLPVVAAALDAYLDRCPYALAAGAPVFLGLRGKRLQPAVVRSGCRRAPRRMRCATASRPICWPPAPICA
jgi:integrase/recombinase XerC